MGIVRVQWKKLHSWEFNGTFSIALLENGTFYLISRGLNQPIKRPEFNEVLYKEKSPASQLTHGVKAYVPSNAQMRISVSRLSLLLYLLIALLQNVATMQVKYYNVRIGC